MRSRIIRGLLLATLPLFLGQSPSWKSQRLQMVEEQLVTRGITDEAVLKAMRNVRRHEFIPEEFREFSYLDSAVPIGLDQTISQPYIVAFMTEKLELRPKHKLLELGTGSGYQAAVASRLVAEVYTVEILPELAARARDTLARLGHDNVHVSAGDGWAGWPSEAPFDRIIVTAAAEELPQALIDQLAPGGKMILPLGPQSGVQELVLLTKSRRGEVRTEKLLPVRFVPITGEH